MSSAISFECFNQVNRQRKRGARLRTHPPRVFAYESSSKSIVLKYSPSSEDLPSVVEVAVDVAALSLDRVEAGEEQVLLASEDAGGPVVVPEAVLHGAGLAVVDFGAAEVEVSSLGAPLERLAA